VGDYSRLLGIARNKLAHRRRRAAIETAARRKLGMPRLTYSDVALERVENLLGEEGRLYTNGAAALPDAERQAVVARVIEERDYEEIAAATGATPAAIRQRVSRGLAKLARLGREER
jgi:DNA-directed RNA polymerase specialized sigma24 family protein